MTPTRPCCAGAVGWLPCSEPAEGSFFCSAHFAAWYARGHKRCTKCGETRPIVEFPRVHRRGKHDRGAQCKPCVNARMVAWRRSTGRVAPDAIASKLDEHRDPAERFWEKVQKTDGCWLWLANKNGHGYGRFSRGGHNEGGVQAHRYAYELAVGPIPEGLVVCHHCDNPSCVRPDHLFVGTQRDNVLDAWNKGRHKTPTGQRNAWLERWCHAPDRTPEPEPRQLGLMEAMA